MDNKSKNPLIVLTRYLYIKDEVRVSLLTSILEKKEARSLFWAYELYHSGFKEELIHLLWKIYYEFFHSVNPSYYAYFIKKHKEWNQKPYDEVHIRIIYILVMNLIIRPYNMDVFLIRNITKQSKQTSYESSYIEEFRELVKERRFVDFYKYMHSYEPALLDGEIIVEAIINKICGTKDITRTKIITQLVFHDTNQMESSVILLANIVAYFTILDGKTMGKKIYISCDDKIINGYATITKVDTPVISRGTNHERHDAYQILPTACTYAIDQDNMLSLFNVERSDGTVDIVNIYYYQWLYYASLSPVWLQRIMDYGGTVVKQDKQVIFNDDDDMEAFYQEYGMDPEEQTTETQRKNIQPIDVIRNWSSYYEEHMHQGIVKPNYSQLTKMRNIRV